MGALRPSAAQAMETSWADAGLMAQAMAAGWVETGWAVPRTGSDRLTVLPTRAAETGLMAKLGGELGGAVGGGGNGGSVGGALGAAAGNGGTATAGCNRLDGPGDGSGLG